MGTKTKIKVLSENELHKKYGSSANKLSLNPENHLWLPSRILALNWQLGGGIPYGSFIEIFGYESTGKSLIATDFASVTQALGGKVLWADEEFCYEPIWQEKNGVNPNDIELLDDDNSVEKLSDWILDMALYWRSRLTNNEPITLVIDSLAALECEENIGASAVEGKAQMGNRAKAIYRMFRERNKFIKQLGIVAICINQVRKKVGASMFEAAETTPGGEAMKFYANQRLFLNKGKQIKGRIVNGEFEFRDDAKGVKIGQNVTIGVIKNKVAPPKPSLKTKVYFDDMATGYVGFDRYDAFLEILINEGIIKQSGAIYSFKDSKIAKGFDNLHKLVIEDDDLRRKLIKKSKINTTSTLRSKLESLNKNLFPVSVKAKADE